MSQYRVLYVHADDTRISLQNSFMQICAHIQFVHYTSLANIIQTPQNTFELIFLELQSDTQLQIQDYIQEKNPNQLIATIVDTEHLSKNLLDTSANCFAFVPSDTMDAPYVVAMLSNIFRERYLAYTYETVDIRQ